MQESNCKKKFSLLPMIKLGRNFVLGVLLTVGHASAHTSAAYIPGYIDTNWVSWAWETQERADAEAIAGCKKRATQMKGIPKSAKCEVILRTNKPGYGALVCGEGDCRIAYGAGSEKAAIDTAFQTCVNSGTKGCDVTSPITWLDLIAVKGKSKVPAQAVASDEQGKCQPPAGSVTRSQTYCNNGDCTRTFENGCRIRFQAKYCVNPATGVGEWKPDGCI